MTLDSNDDRRRAGIRARKSLLRVAPIERATPASLSSEPLPPPGVRRWVHKRKAAVVAALLDGRVSVEKACETYGLSAEEILSWRDLVARHGIDGLRATSLSTFRKRRR